ncbi:MAG: CoA pyrophosphatase [Anaerolineales bacterium]|nr:CoA pyrophosphatase [Anaerolineales bacterium]
MPALPSLSTNDIVRRLAETPFQENYNPFPTGFFTEPARSAAILVPFVCIQDNWHLLFIRRTKNEHDRHGGQVAFPGGRMDPTDPDVTAVALREAEEEVGLRPTDIQILGRMHEFHSVTNYNVTPIVGVFPWPYTFEIDPHEVSRTFTIPLAWLADPSNYQIMQRHFPQSRAWPIVYFDPYDGEALWGFTAQVVMQLVRILTQNK